MLSCVWGVSFLQQTKLSSHPVVYPAPTSPEVKGVRAGSKNLVGGKTDASYALASSELPRFPI